MVADQLHRPQSILVRSTAPGAESLSPHASKMFVFIYILMIPPTYVVVTNGFLLRYS